MPSRLSLESLQAINDDLASRVGPTWNVKPRTGFVNKIPELFEGRANVRFIKYGIHQRTSD